MPSPRKQARLKLWRGTWHVFYTDFTKYPPVERRVSCGFKGKKPNPACKKLLNQHLTSEKRESVQAETRGGGAAYDTLLTKALARYLVRCDKRVETREKNPAAREEGLSASSRRLLALTIDRFKAWLTETGRAGLTTGRLTGSIIEEYRLHYASGNRSKATIAAEVRNLRCALRWIDAQSPVMFRDFGHSIGPALKPGRGKGLRGLAFTPAELTTFMRAALERESPEYQNEVERRIRKGARAGRVQNFKQGPAKSSGTPLSRLFLLATLTGARVGELLALKWEHVDLARGRLTIHAEKTGATRILPLTGAPEGEVAPLLVDLLKHWKLQAGAREYVLPHDGMAAPAFPKSAWALVVKDTESSITGPQKLRKNFTSYAASLGIPSAVAALWQGHSPTVATEYYRQQLLDRQQATDLEGATSLDKIIEAMIPASLRAKVPAGA